MTLSIATRASAEYFDNSRPRQPPENSGPGA